MTLIISEAAQADAEGIGRGLECQATGLGLEFADDLHAAYEKIAAQPRLHSPTPDGPPGIETREYYVRRFKYRVIYLVTAEEVVVVAIAHARRRPGYWRDRLAGES